MRDAYWVIYIPKPSAEHLVYGVFSLLLLFLVILPTYKAIRAFSEVNRD